MFCHNILAGFTAFISVAITIELFVLMKKKFWHSENISIIPLVVKKARAVLQDSGYELQTSSTSDLNSVLFFPDPGIACLSLVNGKGSCKYENCRFLHHNTSLVTLGKILNLSEKRLDVCVYVLTCVFFQNIIIESRKRGAVVRVILDKGQTEQAQGAERNQGVLLANGVNVRLSQSVSLMHHKFALVDGEILINGSFNWTQQAITANYENLIITSAPVLVQPFVEEFERIWEALKPNM